MKLNNLVINSLIVLSILGIVVSIYGKLNPEFGSDFWSSLSPNIRIVIITVLFLIPIFISFPRKGLVKKRVSLSLYIKPLFWLGLLLYFWYQWFKLG